MACNNGGRAAVPIRADVTDIDAAQKDLLDRAPRRTVSGEDVIKRENVAAHVNRPIPVKPKTENVVADAGRALAPDDATPAP